MKKLFDFPLLAIIARAMVSLGGCISHRIYNEEPHEYLQTLQVDGVDEAICDLAIIEFDDHGTFWKLDQMEDTIHAIRQRNREAKRGILVITYVHGWKHNADPNRAAGNLATFRDELIRVARAQYEAGAPSPDHVIGVYLGWRGATSRVPVQEQLTFWGRRQAAERVASLNMREALFRVMTATKERPESKCFIVGHSMGGLIVGRTLAPSLEILLLTNGRDGVQLPADLILLQNPALDALASWQFIDFLKRSNAYVELRSSDGESFESPGPIIVSITSEVDSATATAYPLGRAVSSLFTAFRDDNDESRPSQRHLATHAAGHVDYLVSHRAWVEDGEVVLQRVPNAYNDTPFWIIRVTKDICKDHHDVRNPMFGKLVDQVSRLSRIYETNIQAWMFTD